MNSNSLQTGTIYEEPPLATFSPTPDNSSSIGNMPHMAIPLLPDVKTFEEMSIKGIELNNWSAIYVAKTVPEAQVTELNRAIRKVVENPAVKDKLRASGVELQASSPAELNAMVQADLARWRQVILAHEIKPE